MRDRLAIAVAAAAASWLAAALTGTAWIVFLAGAATVAMPPLLIAAAGSVRASRIGPLAVWLQAAHAASWWPPGDPDGWSGGLPAASWALLVGLWLVPLVAVAWIAAREPQP